MKRLRRKRRVESPGPPRAEVDFEASSTRSLYELHLHTARLFQSGHFTNDDLGNLLRSHIGFLEEQKREGREIFSESPFFQVSPDILGRKRDDPNDNRHVNSAPGNVLRRDHQSYALSPTRMLSASIQEGLSSSQLPPPHVLFPTAAEVGHPRSVQTRDGSNSHMLRQKQGATDLRDQRIVNDLNATGAEGKERREGRVDQRSPRSKSRLLKDTIPHDEGNAFNYHELSEERPVHNPNAKEGSLYPLKRIEQGTTGSPEGKNVEPKRGRKVLSGEERTKEFDVGDAHDEGKKGRKRSGMSSGLRYPDQVKRSTTATAVGKRDVPPKLPNVDSTPTPQNTQLFPMGDRNCLIARPRQDETFGDTGVPKEIEDSVNGTNNYIDLPDLPPQTIPSPSNPFYSKRDVQNTHKASTVYDTIQRNQYGSRNNCMRSTTEAYSPERAPRKSSTAQVDLFGTCEGQNQLERRSPVSHIFAKDVGGDFSVRSGEEVDCGMNGGMEDANLAGSEETIVGGMKAHNEKSYSADFPGRDIELVDGTKILATSYQDDLYMDCSPSLAPPVGPHCSGGRSSPESSGIEGSVHHIRPDAPDQLSRDAGSCIDTESKRCFGSLEDAGNPKTVKDGTKPNGFLRDDSKNVSEHNESVEDILPRNRVPEKANVRFKGVAIDSDGGGQNLSYNDKQIHGTENSEEENCQDSGSILEAKEQAEIQARDLAVDSREKFTEIEMEETGARVIKDIARSVDNGQDSENEGLVKSTNNSFPPKATSGIETNGIKPRDQRSCVPSAARWNEDTVEQESNDRICSSADRRGNDEGVGSVMLHKDSNPEDAIQPVSSCSKPKEDNIENGADPAKSHSDTIVAGDVTVRADVVSSPRKRQVAEELKTTLRIFPPSLSKGSLIDNSGGEKEEGNAAQVACGGEKMQNEALDSCRTERYDHDEREHTFIAEHSSEGAVGAGRCHEPHQKSAHEIVTTENVSGGVSREEGSRGRQDEGSVNSNNDILFTGDVPNATPKAIVSHIQRKDDARQEKEKHVRFAIDARKIFSPRTPGKLEAARTPASEITAEEKSSSSAREFTVDGCREEGGGHDESPTTAKVEKARHLVTTIFEDFNEEEVRAFLNKMKKVPPNSLADRTSKEEHTGMKEPPEEANSGRTRASARSNADEAPALNDSAFSASFVFWREGRMYCMSPSDALDVTVYREWQEAELDSAAVSFALLQMEKEKSIEVCSDSHIFSYMHSIKCRVKGSWVREDKVLKSCRLGLPEKSCWYFIPMLIEVKNEAHWALICIQGISNAFQSLLDFSNFDETTDDVVKKFGSIHIVVTKDIDIPKLYLECIDKFIWGIVRYAYYTFKKEYPKVVKSRHVRSIVQHYMRNMYCINLVQKGNKESSGAYIISAASSLSTLSSMNRFHDDVLKRTAGNTRRKNGLVKPTKLRIPGMISMDEVATTMNSTYKRVATLLEGLE